jgi:DNA-binding CsgD family transcriptional regulator
MRLVEDVQNNGQEEGRVGEGRRGGGQRVRFGVEGERGSGQCGGLVSKEELEGVLGEWAEGLKAVVKETAERTVKLLMGEMDRRFDELKRELGVGAEMDVATLEKLALTRAELRLAVALFHGRSVEGYAKEAGISINTARWHVKQIYQKAGVRRQTELIHLLLKKPGGMVRTPLRA